MRPIWSPRSENPLALWLTRRAWENHAEQTKVAIARDTGTDLTPTRQRAAGDPRTARGIPIAGFKGGVGGSMNQTQPEREVLRREAKAERDHDRYSPPDG